MGLNYDIRTLIDTLGRGEQIRFDAITAVRCAVFQLLRYGNHYWVEVIAVEMNPADPRPRFYLDIPQNWEALAPFTKTDTGRVEVWISWDDDPPWFLQPIALGAPDLPLRVFTSQDEALRGRQFILRTA